MQASDHIRDIFGRFLLFFVFGTAAGGNRCPGRSVSVKGTVFRTDTFLYRSLRLQVLPLTC